MWSDGTFIEDTYTYGYYKMLSPFFQRFRLLISGADMPPLAGAQTHCELGFGQGVSLNIHAAAVPGSYFGTDFMPAHAAHANELLEASGANGRFLDLGFAELLHLDDLPMFDSISLHGVWSWISRENQNAVVQFVRRFLKPGGVFYNSYNCLPGWNSKAPLRELMALKDEYARAQHGAQGRAGEAIAFAEKFIQAVPGWAQRHPEIAPALEKLKSADARYFAHEYLNRSWTPSYFTGTMEQFEDAKLDFACSGSLLDALDALESINMPEETRQFLLAEPHPLVREELRDFAVMRQFRGDLCVKGLRRLPEPERLRRLLACRYVLTKAAPPEELKVNGYQKGITIKKELTDSIFAHLLADSARPKDFTGFDMEPAVLTSLLIAMTENGIIAPVQDDESIRLAAPGCGKLNRFICARSLYSQDIKWLANPTTGTGLNADQITQMMLHFFWSDGSTRDLDRKVWNVLRAQKRALIVGGRELHGDDENLAELQRRAETFTASELPLLERLKIA